MDLSREQALGRQESLLAPLIPTPAPCPPPFCIAPRPWLYGETLIGGQLSVLAAAGGTGKSALVMAEAVAMASGRSLLGARVFQPLRVWLLALEEPEQEIARRLVATLRHYGLTEKDLGGRLFATSGRTRRLTLGAHDATGFTAPDRDALIAGMIARKIDVLVIDPFIRCHLLDENSNAEMDFLASVLIEVAEVTGAAVLVVHHVRKGAAAEADGVRGARALIDAARSARMLQPMSEAEAETLGIPARERGRYVRIEAVKANLAPRRTAPRWFEIVTVALGNGTPAYPEGDLVGVAAPFDPDRLALGPEAEARLLARLAQGPAPGQLFSLIRRSGVGERWAGHVVMAELGCTAAEAVRILKRLAAEGRVREVTYRDPRHRKQRHGLVVEGFPPPLTEAGETARAETAPDPEEAPHAGAFSLAQGGEDGARVGAG